MSKVCGNSRAHLTLTALCLSLAASLCAEFLGAGQAVARETEVRLNDITTPLVPSTLLQGDREFDGNGPDIYASVDLVPVDHGSRIVAKVFFRATETKPDWSKTAEWFTRDVYHAPPGTKVLRILSPTRSEVSFRQPKGAGMEIGFPGEDWAKLIKVIADIAHKAPPPPGFPRLPCGDIAHCSSLLENGTLNLHYGNDVWVRPSDIGGPVISFAIVGDTGGNDISDDKNPKDDTRIVSINFAPVRVDLQ